MPAPPAYAPSPPGVSVRDFETASVRTLPAYSDTRYKGYRSEAEYLAALRAWVQAKEYATPSDQSALVGFYGRKTMREYEGERAGRREDGGGEGEGKRRKSGVGEWLSGKRGGGGGEARR